MTAKNAGADCPTCGELWCAEFALQGEAPQWKCGTCGAGGTLTGAFAGRKPTPTLKPEPAVKPHWRDRGTT